MELGLNGILVKWNFDQRKIKFKRNLCQCEILMKLNHDQTKFRSNEITIKWYFGDMKF